MRLPALLGSKRIIFTQYCEDTLHHWIQEDHIDTLMWGFLPSLDPNDRVRLKICEDPMLSGQDIMKTKYRHLILLRFYDTPCRYFQCCLLLQIEKCNFFMNVIISVTFDLIICHWRLFFLNQGESTFSKGWQKLPNLDLLFLFKWACWTQRWTKLVF